MAAIDWGKNYNENASGNKPDSLGYDLDWEKQRVTEGTEEIKKELLEKWQKRYAGAEIFPSAVSNINPDVINFLLSFKNTLFYNDLARKFNLNSEQRDALPQIIWRANLDNSWDQIESIIRDKFNLNAGVAASINELLKQNIIAEIKKLLLSNLGPSSFHRRVEKKEIKTVRLSLSQALKEYPKLESQQVTNDFLRLRYSEFPSRPTIKNWITDYYQNLGVGSHGIMERGNFLFHSENCKKLTSAERQRLALVFKSLSENMPLVIDAEKQEIVFPRVSSMEQGASGRQPASPARFDESRRTGKQETSEPFASYSEAFQTGEMPALPASQQDISIEKQEIKDKGTVRFFSGQDMKPTPPETQSMEHVTHNIEQAQNIEYPTQNLPTGRQTGRAGVEREMHNIEQPSNADNLRFSSPQKLPAERDKQEAEDSTLRIYPRRFMNNSRNNSSANTQDVKISGNVVDLKGSKY